MSLLTLRNRQRAARVDRRYLKRIILTLLQDYLPCDAFELGVFLVGEAAITRINRNHLGHLGSTDVITFDYCDPDEPGLLAGEIFVCVPEAITQAQRFRTTWQSELVRYIVHGVLHLLDYDDGDLVSRRKMKREEDRLVKRLAENFRLAGLGGHGRRPGKLERAAA